MPRESEPRRWGKFGRLANEEYMSRQALDGINGTVLTFSNAHPTTLDNLQNLGMTLVARGRLEEADMALRRAWAGRQVLLGHDHPMTLRSQRDLRGAMHRRGRQDRSEDFDTQRNRANQTALTPFKDTVAAPVKRRGGLVAQVKGRKDFLDAAEGARGLRGTLKTDADFILGDRGDNDADVSEDCMDCCLKILRSRTPAGGPTTIGDFGSLLAKQRNLEKAEVMLDKSMKARRTVLGETHPKTIGTTMDLIDVLKKRGRLGAAEELLDRTQHVEQQMTKSMSDSFLPRQMTVGL
eukprot:gnl/MRDRNA2_/MRDRNA2_134389_c0_seq1.p1 gnl/MRDRNA2_/MRDRNA2_134389_c0~~gnl/MRDRNA2_/MRDRNA2_134389_c0_seq1.p1  ORF type:complete len:294 (-),score=59.26 gnl/MRDRNA2_/MRDRNA2_134389_c0_seq1:44-925(-)